MRKFFTIIIICFSTFYLSSQTQTFITSGSFTVPAGVTSIFVEAWGAGGAGGSAVGTGAPTSFRAQAGGGGGGAYVSGTISVMPGDEIVYTVAPTTGSNSGTTPLNGGSSTFGSITALGGNGGECVNAGTSGGHVGGTGGAGGVGDFNGGNGGNRVGYSGSTTGGTSAGGGGGAGDANNGGDANSVSNVGGVGGVNLGGSGANGPSSGNAGAGGSIRGGGGAGAWAAASTTFRNGGAGGRGEIRLTYTALPIKIAFFEILRLNNYSNIKIITASETNNSHFNIERSADARNFESIGEIKGAGNSSKEISYAFTDERPLPGINYYRIKQTDYDGQYSYSEIRSVRHKGINNVSITPRTTEGRLDITTELEDYTIAIYNAAGQEVKKLTGMSLDQSISIETLHAGVYFVKINSGSESETVRIVKI